MVVHLFMIGCEPRIMINLMESGQELVNPAF